MSAADGSAIDPALKAYVDARLAELKGAMPDNRVTLVVFSGELDRQLASLVIATGAAAMGMEVSVFYTFWGLSALKRRPSLQGKGIKEKLFALMTPRRLNRMPVSKMNFGGVGRVMLQSMIAAVSALRRERGDRVGDRRQFARVERRGERVGAVRQLPEPVRDAQYRLACPPARDRVEDGRGRARLAALEQDLRFRYAPRRDASRGPGGDDRAVAVCHGHRIVPPLLVAE